MPFPRKGYPLTIEDCEEIPLKNKNNWMIQGFSKAGERTSFRINPLNILLDVGLLTVVPPKAILLTHCHVDHTWNLPHITGGSKANIKEEIIPVFFPKQAYLGLTKLLEAASILSFPKEHFTEEQVWERHFMEPRPIAVGDRFSIGQIKIEVLQAVHTVHSVGYGFSTEKFKLKKEYKELTNDHNKIIELRKQGIEISEKILEPEFAFYCDSTIDNLLNYTNWEKYPSIIVECTGYPDIYDPEIVQKRGHTHYTDLMKIIHHHEEKNWFFVHSTMKSDKEFLIKYQEELNKNFNVKILSMY